jgi:hypothetical protein
MSPTKKRKLGPPPAPPRRPRIPALLLVRMFVVGSVAIVAACWGIWRYYFVPRPRMIVPATPPTEMPAPEIEPLPPTTTPPR